MGSGITDFLALFALAFQSSSAQGRAFAAVAIAVAALVVLSLVFSAYVMWLRLRNLLRARRWADREARWTDMTLEAVAGERTIEELEAKVGKNERLPFLDFLLRYARRLTGRERERVQELAVPFLPELERLLKNRDVFRRARAVQTLGTLGLPEHSSVLVQAINDDSPVVSMLAARALAAHGGATYAEPILSNLDRFERWGSEYVTSLLAGLGPPAAPRLRDVMADESRSTRVRALATDALSKLHDLEAVAPAARILGGGPEPDLAAALLRMMSVLSDPGQLDLVKTLLDDPHFAVRAEAYSALGVLGQEGDAALLENGLDDPSPWVALHAARGMRARGNQVKLRKLAESGHVGAIAAAQVLAEE